MTNLTCGSLAVGGGVYRGHGLPFMEKFAVEVDGSAAKAYRANYPDTPVLVKDASDPSVLQAAYKEFGATDILTSGFPCQDFSTANSCDRVNSEKNDLYLCALDWVERFRPKAYIAENVANVTRQIQWDLAVDRLRQLGYKVTAWNLNAMRFGVPQDRLRTFLVAVRDEFPLPIRPAETHGPGLLPYVTWEAAMQGLSEAVALVDGHSKLSSRFEWVLRGIPPGMDWRWLYENRDIPGNEARLDYIYFCYGGRPYNNQVAKRLSLDSPSHTLLTAPAICRMMRSVHPGCRSATDRWEISPLTGNVHIVGPNGLREPILTRLISVREYKRLFELHDDWILPSKSIATRYRIIGNGICPRVFRLVCEAVARAISR